MSEGLITCFQVLNYVIYVNFLEAVCSHTHNRYLMEKDLHF